MALGEVALPKVHVSWALGKKVEDSQGDKAVLAVGRMRGFHQEFMGESRVLDA